MSRFTRTGPQLLATLAEYEVALLESLTDQLVSLLEADDLPPSSDDPFAAWQADLDSELDTTDPVLARLFPPAYRDDPSADADYRRFTQTDQRRARIAQARLVLDALAETDGGRHHVVIRAQDADAWLKTLTALRLSLAVRLGIETADDMNGYEDLDEDDPRMVIWGIFEWLGHLSEELLARLG